MLIFKKVSKNLCILFHIRHLLDFRTSICFTTILSTPIYHMVLICTSRCPQLLRPNLLTTCKNKLSAKSASHFEKLNFHKMLGNTWVARKTNVLPLPLLSSVSVHMLSKQGNAHLTLQVTLCHLLSRPHATNITYPALITISSIIIWLVATTHYLFHYVGHTLQFLN